MIHEGPNKTVLLQEHLQEAYRPPRHNLSKHSLSPRGGGGGLYAHPSRSCAGGGGGVYCILPWPVGVPLVLAGGGGTPILTWVGVIPSQACPPGKGPLTSHWGTPQKGHGTSGSIMGWRRTWDQCNYYGMEMGSPPPVLTDRHL